MRWTLSRHLVGGYAREMRERSGQDKNDPDVKHDQCSPAMLQRDETDVQLILKHIENNMTNPFATDTFPDVLLNIATGLHASKAVQNSLLNAVVSGQDKMAAFIKSSFSSGNSNNFHKPISKSSLKTFTDMIPSTKAKAGNGKPVSITVNPEVVFRRALMLSNKRGDISLYPVMSHPVGPLPTSMFHDDGSMRKTSKAELTHQLEMEAAKCSNLNYFANQNSIYIRDAMAILQMMDAGSFRSFNELASSYAVQLLKSLSSADTIVDVFDRYDYQNSVKVRERARRGQVGNARQYQVLGGRPIPPWKKFLSCSENKQSLINFLSNRLVETLG